MAKVKSVSINTSSVVNDAPLAGLVSLEITEELSPSNDIDIDLFFSHDETYLEKQCFDKNKRSVERIDSGLSQALNEKTYTPSNSIEVKKSVNSSFVSLGSLAENHLGKDNMLSELCFDNNFSLSNILINDISENKNSKSTVSNDNLALFDLCLETEVGLQTTENKPEKDSFDLFLSSLNEKSNSGLSSSLNEILSPKNREFSKDAVKIHFNFVPEPSLESTENCSSEASELPDILGFSPPEQQKSADNLLSDLVDLLYSNSSSESFSSDISEPFLSRTSELLFDSSSDNSHTSGEGTSKLDFIPDINLNFCIRDDVKGKLQSSTQALETEDSGYETDLPSGHVSITFGKNPASSISRSSSCPLSENNATKPRRSLFSKALSARPRIDDERQKKLQMIRKKLVTNFPDCYVECDKHKNSFAVEKVVDHTNECVVMSSFFNNSK